MIDICLATYNGEKYLREQIDSIINQSFTNWHLYIRDDGSKDSTFLILREYKYKYKEKIILIEDKKGNLGYALNFVEIAKYTKANYIAFSDQDDVWEPTKLEKLLQDICKLEMNDKTVPCIVHSNCTFIGDNSNRDFLDLYQRRLKYNSDFFKVVFHQGSLLGCASMVNKALLTHLSYYKPTVSIGHDIFLLSIAALYGKHYFNNSKLLLHRLHNSNNSSVGRGTKVGYLLKNYIKGNRPSLCSQEQIAKVISENFDQSLKNEIRKEIQLLAILYSKPFYIRLRFALKHNLIGFSRKGVASFLKILHA